MPTISGYSFLRNLAYDGRLYSSCVNAHYLGLLISTQCMCSYVRLRWCVNAHYLGLLISAINIDIHVDEHADCVNAHYLGLLISTSLFVHKKGGTMKCQCPLSRATHFYPTPLRASVYADFNACFCMYFSELSDFWVQQGQKVGRVQIVF